MSHPKFLSVVSNSWSAPLPQQDPAKLLTAKFKALRSNLKSWQVQFSNIKKTIANVKIVISFLDAVEEWRDFELHEWNFRDILNQKLTDLLHQQMIYWEQRGNIKLVQLGDESSKLFHAQATLRHRRNLITSLSDQSGEQVFYHSQKADLIWNDFKERLGTSNFERMLFDLDSLFTQDVDLSSLEELFGQQEIDEIIKHLPLDKSPGPDGFNNEFMKK